MADKPQNTDWEVYTPEVQHPYTLTLYDGNQVKQELELSREEYIDLKRHLARNWRGLLSAEEPKTPDLPALCSTRHVEECLHYSCWRYDKSEPPLSRDDLECRDADGDDVLSFKAVAILESLPAVTVIIKPGTTTADAVRLLRKVIASIEAQGADAVCHPTEQQHPFLAKHPEVTIRG